MKLIDRKNEEAIGKWRKDGRMLKEENGSKWWKKEKKQEDWNNKMIEVN